MIKPLYIFAILSTNGKAPNSTIMKLNKNYKFMPLGGDAVYTIDKDIWQNKKESILSFFPTNKKYTDIIFKKITSFNTTLIALTNKSKMEIPGRGIVNLIQYKELSIFNTIDIGYDVTDLFGLSAIANIGYSVEEFSEILNLNISITEYGLISNISDAIKFVKFADSHIPEHSPFLALKIKKISFS